VAEKNLKSKLKLVESKAKEIKTQASQESIKKTDDKMKAKVQVLEKNNEFLKLKIINLEKKITQEKENTQLLSNKMSKITLKSSNQEKIIKELQKNPKPDSFIQETPQNNQSIITKQSEIIESSEILEEETENLPKPKQIIKKNNDDAIVLLNLLTNMSNCLKHTLPVLLQEENATINEEAEKETFDIGSIFYPNFNKIMSDLIELSPILNKKFEIKSLHNYVDFLYKVTNFAFRFKSLNSSKSNFSSLKLESSSNRVKSLQDHVNEIMLSSSKFIKLSL